MRLSSAILTAILTTTSSAGAKAAGGTPVRSMTPTQASNIAIHLGKQPLRGASPGSTQNQLYSQFLTLHRKQIALEEGARMLEETRVELRNTQRGLEFWGQTAVIANIVIIPLNVIVNSLELKQANTVLKVFYMELVKIVYRKYAQSGTRIDAKSQPMLAAKLILAGLKKGIVEGLKGKGLEGYIPGVNIIVGLAEDSLALYQSMDMTAKGSSEILRQNFLIDQQATRVKQELLRLGIDRAEVLRRAAVVSRIS